MLGRVIAEADAGGGYAPPGGGGVVDRAQAVYAPRYQRFVVRERHYTQQFSHIYTRRLQELRPTVWEAARRKWGSPGVWKACHKMIELRPNAAGTQFVVVGCTYKTQPLKPSILDEYSGDRGLEPLVSRANYASIEDSLVLEDETGRVVLAAGMWDGGVAGAAAGAGGGASAGAIDLTTAPAGGKVRVPLRRLVDGLVTGVILAVRGRVLDSGEFAVDDVAVPGLVSAPGVHVPHPLPSYLFAAGAPPLFVLLVSNLGAARGTVAAPDRALRLQLLADYVTGLAGGPSEVAGVARIARVIVAGGALGQPASDPAFAHRTATSGGAGGGGGGVYETDKAAAAAEQEAASAALRDADSYLSQMAAGVAVDILPGSGEPANTTLPQQPLPPLLFPASARYSSFRAVTNPYDAEIGGVRILGSSGQPVTDVRRFTRRVDVMTPGDELGLRGRGADGGGGEGGGAAGHADPMELIAATGAGADAPARVAGGDPVAEAALVASLSPLDALVNTLLWRHVAPTAPDTLPCYPHVNEDPFVISDAGIPHVYFAGGQPDYGSRLVTDPLGGPVRVRVVCVPDFLESGTAVLVNLRSPTFETQPITFVTPASLAAGGAAGHAAAGAKGASAGAAAGAAASAGSSAVAGGSPAAVPRPPRFLV